MEIRLIGDMSDLSPLLKQWCLRTDMFPAGPGYSSLLLVPDAISGHKI